MANLPAPESERWAEAFDVRGDARGHRGEGPRNRLREALMRMRENAYLLAGEIGTDLPELTIHDGSHLDALWNVLDLVTAKECLNPVEAFVLGAAFLTHDLAMSRVAVRPIADIRKDPMWADLVVRHISDKIGYLPSREEVAEHRESTDIERRVTSDILRRRHAEYAEKICLTSWPNSAESDEVYLIGDDGLRRQYGYLAGQIAASHWWDISRVCDEYGGAKAIAGAPTWAPLWPVNALKVACFLRVADACQLDDRRAPTILRFARGVRGLSEEHWFFQDQLAFPVVDGESLVFRSKSPFSHGRHESWWICYGELRKADRELRQSVALLEDNGMQGLLRVSRIAGAESPERMADLVQCAGWAPIDAQLHVADVLSVVERFAGRQLYGDSPRVPVRELLQNSIDAVRARRILEERDKGWGEVRVRITSREDGLAFEVHDVGVGMSQDVLAGPLITFGHSYWTSEMFVAKGTGLLGRGFRPAGKYGIGFFSILMVTDQIKVRTRTPDDGVKGTRVLEYRRGSSRVLIREALEYEQLHDPGTVVSFAIVRHREFFERLYDDLDTFVRECAYLCPASEVSIVVENDRDSACALESGDWRNLDAWSLLNRISDSPLSESARTRLELPLELLEELAEEDGTVVGRLAYLPGISSIAGEYGPGLLAKNLRMAGVDEGTRVGDLEGAVGLVLARPAVVARNSCRARASWPAMRSWLLRQLDGWLPRTEGVNRVVVSNMLLALSDAERRDLLDVPVIWTKAGQKSLNQLPEVLADAKVLKIMFLDYIGMSFLAGIFSMTSKVNSGLESIEEKYGTPFALLARDDWKDDEGVLMGSYIDLSLERQGAVWTNYSELRYSNVLGRYGRQIARVIAESWGVTADEVVVQIDRKSEDSLLTLTLRALCQRNAART